jgi:adenosine deaminase
MSKRSYVDAVIKGLRSVSSVDVDFVPMTEDSKSFTNDKCNGNSRKRIIVRLILSIDRRETTEAAMETVS